MAQHTPRSYRGHAYSPDAADRTKTDARALNYIAATIAVANADPNRADHLAETLARIEALVRDTGRPTTQQR